MSHCCYCKGHCGVNRCYFYHSKLNTKENQFTQLPYPSLRWEKASTPWRVGGALVYAAPPRRTPARPLSTVFCDVRRGLFVTWFLPVFCTRWVCGEPVFLFVYLTFENRITIRNFKLIFDYTGIIKYIVMDISMCVYREICK